MSHLVKVLPDADHEANEAVVWYEERVEGLGGRFRESIEYTVLAIMENTLAFPVVEGTRIRRALVEGFPYIVLFTIEEDFVLVISVFHTSRNPMIWRGRLD
jgi:toxin ParE1/3/4